MAELKANKSMKRSVAMAYHPDPKQTLIETPTGWVRVVYGEPGYTLNTGETVRLSSALENLVSPEEIKRIIDKRFES